MEVQLRDGHCTSNGRLAGSVLTLDRGVRNFMEFTGAGLNMAVAAASGNPARLMGIDEDWGRLEVGQTANITVLSASAEVVQTFLAGEPAVMRD
jgi:N-acetylglucosamine-6-phosphate deacetylase